MISNTDGELTFAYVSVREIIKEFPLMVETLQGVYNKPSCYEGYYLENIVGNLTLRGSIPADINHSAILAFFGK